MFFILLLILSAHMSISEQATRALTLAPGNHASLIGEVNEESINNVIETINLVSHKKPHKLINKSLGKTPRGY